MAHRRGGNLYSQKYDAYQEGRISDDQWLHYLHQRVQDTPKGSSERKSAEDDLVMETFRVTENQLVHDVQVNGADPKTLIRFYQTSLASMDHSSARGLDIQTKIQNLQLGNIDPINLGGSTTTGPSLGHSVGGNVAPPTGRGGGSAADAFVAAASSYLGMNYRLGQEGQNGSINCSGSSTRPSRTPASAR